MQETRKRFGISRKALATGVAAALLISGVGAVSASASSKKPAKKPAATKPAAATEIYDFYNPKCPSKPTTLRIATAIILEVGGAVEQQIADDFMKACPNVKVEFIAIPSNDLGAKLTTMAIGGIMPDIYLHLT